MAAIRHYGWLGSLAVNNTHHYYAIGQLPLRYCWLRLAHAVTPHGIAIGDIIVTTHTHKAIGITLRLRHWRVIDYRSLSAEEALAITGHWHGWLHYGVILLATGDYDITPLAWSLRHIGHWSLHTLLCHMSITYWLLLHYYMVTHCWLHYIDG